MIKFVKHNAIKNYKIKNFLIKKGDKIVKVLFEDKDIHISRNGKMHLDIWGSKLKELIILTLRLNNPMKEVLLNDKELCLWRYAALSHPDDYICMDAGVTCDFKGLNPEKNCPRYKTNMKEAKAGEKHAKSK